MPVSILLGLVIAAAIVFDGTSGMNDVSGMVAAPLATGTLRPLSARLVILAGVFCGPFLAQAAVARAYASGIVRLPLTTAAAGLWILAVGLAGATTWNLVARWRGWPTSSSHALVGSLLGAALVAERHLDAVHWGWRVLIATHHAQGVIKVVAALILSPILGGAAGWLLNRALRRLLRYANRRIVIGLRVLHGVVLYVQGISYGMNDAQKTMGIVSAALLIVRPGGPLELSRTGIMGVPTWVRLLSVSSITIGAMIGSGAIVRKLGKGVFNLHVLEALAAQSGATAVVFAASALGGPVSSGQVLASSLVGAGSATRGRAVRWSAVAAILKSWFITIPGAAAVGAVVMLLVVVASGGKIGG